MLDNRRITPGNLPISPRALRRISLAMAAAAVLFLTLTIVSQAAQRPVETQSKSTVSTPGRPKEVRLLSAADVSLVKNDANPNVRPGGTLTYRIFYENGGVLPAADVRITDTLPAHTTHLYDDAASQGWTATVSDTMVIWRRDVLTVAESGNFDVVLIVSEDAPAGASLRNRADIATSTDEDNTGNNTWITGPSVVRVADVKVAKSGPAEVGSGEQITYTIDYSNEGSEPADNVVITDTLPDGVAYVGSSGDVAAPPMINGQEFVWQAGSLSPATEGRLLVFGQVDPNQPSYNVLTNTVTIGTQTPERDHSDNTATSMAVVRPGAPASVQLDVPTSVTVDTTAEFTVTVLDRWANPVADNTSVSFDSDELISPDASAVTIRGVATATLTAGAEVGTAVITATAGSVADTSTLELVPGPVGDLKLTAGAPTQTVGEFVGLEVEVFDSYGNTVEAGIPVSFTTSMGEIQPLTTHTDASGIVTATLTTTRTGAVSVSAYSDGVQDSTTVQFTPGPTDRITVAADPTAVPVDGETSEILATLFDRYDNRVRDGISVTFASSLGTISPVTATTTVSGEAKATLQSGPIHGQSAVTVTMDAYTATTQVEFLPADLRIDSTHSPSGEILPGTAVTYTITYENAGSAVARGVVITNTLPSGFTGTTFDSSGASLTLREGGTTYIWDVEDLAPGEGGTIVLHGYFDRTVPWPASQLVANIANIKSDTAEGDSGDNTTSAGNIVVTSDLFVRTIIDDSGTNLKPGKKIKYLVTLGNEGPALAHGAIITDTLPPHTSLWDWGELGPGAPGLTYVSDPADSVQVWRYDGIVDGPNFGQFYVWLDIDSDAPGGKVLQNRVEASTETPEGDFDNNVEIIETRLSGVNLEVLTMGPTTVTPGRMITYTLRYTNTGTLPAEGVTLVDRLPAGISVIHFSEEPDRIEPGGVEWDLGTVTDGQWRQIVVVGRVEQDVEAGQTLRNTLSITTTSSESYAGDNTAEANTLVIPDAPDSLTLEMDPKTVSVGTSSPLSVNIMDQFGNPIDGLTVTLTATLGVVTPTVVTTEQGIAAASFIAPTSPAEGTVAARFEELSSTLEVAVVPGPPGTLQVEVEDEALPADGESTTVIRAQVRDAYDNPVEDGTAVIFDTDRGTLYNDRAQHTVGTLDSIASTILRTSRSPGIAHVVISTGTLATEVEVEFTLVPVNYIRLPLIMRDSSSSP